jgi:hypothetical protein
VASAEDCTECGQGNSYKTCPDIDLKAGARGGRIALKAAQMSNIQKNLYGCYFDITLSDNSHFTGTRASPTLMNFIAGDSFRKSPTKGRLSRLPTSLLV